MNFNIESVEKMIDNLNKMKSCDETCKRNKAIQQKKKEYEEAVYNYKNAKPLLEKAKHSYLKVSKSESEYNKYIKNENTKKAKVLLDKLTDIKNSKLLDISKKLKYVENANLFNSAIKHKLYNFEKEKNKIHKKKNKLESESLIQKRLTIFNNENIEYLSNFNSIMYVLYYVLFIIILGIAIFKKQYTNIRMFMVLILIGLLPLLINMYYLFLLSSLKHTIIDNIYIILSISFLSLTFVLHYIINSI
tara:strand:+ start:978 stop:1718 length:741 start_codon:yes stop_codon:yes gene_type:complete